MPRELIDRLRTDRLPRRVAVVVLVAAMLVPTAAWARNTFTDVPFSSSFHGDIDWMAETGVTRGCNPPANDRYCPDQFVTRAQMAAFMHRLETRNVFVTPEELSAELTALEQRLDSDDVFVTVEELEEQTRAIDGMTPVAAFSVGSSGIVQRLDTRAPVTGVSVTVVSTGIYDVTIAGLPFKTSERVVCQSSNASGQDRAVSVSGSGDAMRVTAYKIGAGTPTVGSSGFTCVVYN